MTGFGESRRQEGDLAVAVEARSINNRYFKLSIRASEGYSILEAQIENLTRRHVKRGTIQINLRVERAHRADDYRLNVDVLAGYARQLQSAKAKLDWKDSEPLPLGALLAMPGVVDERPREAASVEADWPLIEATLEAALAGMNRMRADEGKTLAEDLSANGAIVTRELEQIERRAPTVTESYRARLTERLAKTLEDFQVTLDPADLVREAAIFAERCDISEEIVRLRSHLEQFASIMAAAESSGRKLDFLTQEMFREANTIGSKANDVQISRHVIEIKAAVERIREMIQNVE